MYSIVPSLRYTRLLISWYLKWCVKTFNTESITILRLVPILFRFYLNVCERFLNINIQINIMQTWFVVVRKYNGVVPSINKGRLKNYFVYELPCLHSMFQVYSEYTTKTLHTDTQHTQTNNCGFRIPHI